MVFNKTETNRLKFTFRYEMSNCLFEATLQRIEEECGCTPKYFVDIIEGFETCEGIQKQCMKLHMEEMGELRIIKDQGIFKVRTQQFLSYLSECQKMLIR
jgi:hypothetical protein